MGGRTWYDPPHDLASESLKFFCRRKSGPAFYGFAAAGDLLKTGRSLLMRFFMIECATDPKPKKIGIFGGSFDPVHLGHLHLAGLAQEALDLDEVRFVPCQISPHKIGQAVTAGEARCKMLRLATAEIPWAVVDDREIRQIGPSYSVLTAETLAAEFPGARLFWIMGGDQWESLPRWKDPEKLAGLVEFIVLGRGQPLLAREGFRLHCVPGAHPASATEIRREISLGAGDAARRWLDPRVAEWIARHALYQAP